MDSLVYILIYAGAITAVLALLGFIAVWRVHRGRIAPAGGLVPVAHLPDVFGGSVANPSVMSRETQSAPESRGKIVDRALPEFIDGSSATAPIPGPEPPFHIEGVATICREDSKRTEHEPGPAQEVPSPHVPPACALSPLGRLSEEDCSKSVAVLQEPACPDQPDGTALELTAEEINEAEIVPTALPRAAGPVDAVDTGSAAGEGSDGMAAVAPKADGERPLDIQVNAPEPDATKEPEELLEVSAEPMPAGLEQVRLEIEEDDSSPNEPEAGAVLSDTERSGTEGVDGSRPNKPAVHRDRRGKRRTTSVPIPAPDNAKATPAHAVRPPADAWLRLALHTIRRTASLSLVLTRPDGFPERTTIALEGRVEVGAYNDARYDDVDVVWNTGFLSGEVRVGSSDGFQWVRSARRIHIFAGHPNEADLVSVSAARAGADHAVICRTSDVPAVRAIAASAGSPELESHDHWQGIPDGWSILSGYVPVRTAATISDAAFRPLDPGVDVDIIFVGGLAVRPRVFAEGRAPGIEINPVPESASVTISGKQASLNELGAWEAPGWNMPGQHIVDVVPGPSLSYEIAADPGNGAGWSFWNAHEQRFAGHAPWARAEICGAMLNGPKGEAVLAYEAQPTLIALGASRGATTLQQRADADACVALVPEPPPFLFSSSGQRRTNGRIIWLGLSGTATSALNARHSDFVWANTIYSAASRRLPLVGADSFGAVMWRKAVARARRQRRQRQ